jgi:hypothetical protein
MAEAYSSRVHRILMLTRLAAGQRGAAVAEIEDLLLALVVEDQGGPQGSQVKLFGTHSADLRDPQPHSPFLSAQVAQSLLARLEAACPRSEPIPAAREIPASGELQHVLATAAAWRDELGRPELRPLHLFLALTSGEPTRVAKMLASEGVTHESVVSAEREESVAGVAGARTWGDATGLSVGPSLWSRRSRQVLLLARLKAQRRRATAVEVEDLLLSILIEDQGGLRRAASGVPGINLAALVEEPHVPLLGEDLAASLIAQLEALCGGSEAGPLPSALPMSAPVKRSLRDADILRGALGHAEIEPAHWLAALVGQGSSAGARMLRDAGITQEWILDLLRRR